MDIMVVCFQIFLWKVGFLWILQSPSARAGAIGWKLQEGSSQVIVEKNFPTKLSQNKLCMLLLAIISFLPLVAIKQKLDDHLVRNCQWNLSPGLGQSRETKGKMNQILLRSSLTQNSVILQPCSKLNFCCLGVRWKFVTTT